jgi:hypothetical protein
MKLIISFATYPRNGNTYKILERTFKSLIVNIKDIEILILVVGDDYNNIDELKPIFNHYNVEFYNININDALRNYNTTPKMKWMQAVQRSKIFILEKALTYDYDYIIMSSDDDLYINNKLKETIKYINLHKPDFLFSLGYHVNKRIIPVDLKINYPVRYKCISSGCVYNLKNIEFINTMIEFRKKKWQEVLEIINNVKKYPIGSEDGQLWEYLMPYFKSNKFKSVLIPKILVNHDTEGTLINYL